MYCRNILSAMHVCGSHVRVALAHAVILHVNMYLYTQLMSACAHAMYSEEPAYVHIFSGSEYTQLMSCQLVHM